MCAAYQHLVHRSWFVTKNVSFEVSVKCLFSIKRTTIDKTIIMAFYCYCAKFVFSQHIVGSVHLLLYSTARWNNGKALQAMCSASIDK